MHPEEGSTTLWTPPKDRPHLRLPICREVDRLGNTSECHRSKLPSGELVSEAAPNVFGFPHRVWVQHPLESSGPSLRCHEVGLSNHAMRRRQIDRVRG